MFAELAPLETATFEFLYDPQTFGGAPFWLHAPWSPFPPAFLKMGSSYAYGCTYEPTSNTGIVIVRHLINSGISNPVQYQEYGLVNTGIMP